MKIENIAEANKLIAQRDVCIKRINEFKKELQNVLNRWYHETDDAYPNNDENTKAYCLRMRLGGEGTMLRLNKQSVLNLLQQNIVIMEERKKEIEDIISSL